MKAVTLLRRARERLARGWCQWSAAVDPDGWPTRAESSKAVAWCLTGALEAEVGREDWFDRQEMIEATLLLNLAEPRVKGGPDWNNMRSRTQKQVLAVVDRAIAIGENPPPDVRERAERIVEKNAAKYREMYQPAIQRLARRTHLTQQKEEGDV